MKVLEHHVLWHFSYERWVRLGDLSNYIECLLLVLTMNVEHQNYDFSSVQCDFSQHSPEMVLAFELYNTKSIIYTCYFIQILFVLLWHQKNNAKWLIKFVADM